MEREALVDRLSQSLAMDVETVRAKYEVGSDSQSWELSKALDDLHSRGISNNIVAIDYRPLDRRWTIYTGSQGGIHFFPASKVSDHLMGKNNLAICYTRKIEGGRDFADIFLTVAPFTLHSLSIKEVNSAAPLYLYPEEGTLDQTIRLNLDPKVYAKIREAAGLTGPQVPPDGTDAFRKASGEARPDEVKVFDYIYGVLHAPNYRETYREFLKIDFPRVPFPRDPVTFRHVSEKGEALRRLHLMEDAAIGEAPYPFEGEGDSVLEKPRLEQGKVWINTDQGFAGVSDTAWSFHIGGYQPAQKWLKDRKGRTLSWDDVRHYQKIIKILTETDRIMKEIELPLD
jgi:predicted helicase